MEKKIYQYRARIHLVPDKGGAYVEFPYNIREEFGRGLLKSNREKLGKTEGDEVEVVVRER